MLGQHKQVLHNPVHIQCHVWQLIKDVKQSEHGGRGKVHMVLITWLHLVNQTLKMSEVSRFDLQSTFQTTNTFSVGSLLI